MVTAACCARRGSPVRPRHPGLPPLVGAVHGDPEEGYVLATDPKVAQLRLTLLGKELTSSEPAR